MKQRMDSDEFATVAFLQQGKIRYEAQWIKKQAFDSSGELDPDNDEYGYSQHASREQAERSAIIASKKTQVEWILVAEQKFLGYQWVDQRRWTGDWDGLHCETFNVDA